MYVCVCMCVCQYVCRYVGMREEMNVCMCGRRLFQLPSILIDCIHVCICVYIYMYVTVCMYVGICVYMCVCMNVYVCVLRVDHFCCRPA